MKKKWIIVISSLFVISIIFLVTEKIIQEHAKLDFETIQNLCIKNYFNDVTNILNSKKHEGIDYFDGEYRTISTTYNLLKVGYSYERNTCLGVITIVQEQEGKDSGYILNHSEYKIIDLIKGNSLPYYRKEKSFQLTKGGEASIEKESNPSGDENFKKLVSDIYELSTKKVQIDQISSQVEKEKSIFLKRIQNKETDNFEKDLTCKEKIKEIELSFGRFVNKEEATYNPFRPYMKLIEVFYSPNKNNCLIIAQNNKIGGKMLFEYGSHLSESTNIGECIAGNNENNNCYDFEELIKTKYKTNITPIVLN